MIAAKSNIGSAPARKPFNDRLVFKLLVLATFPAFLLAALIHAVLPGRDGAQTAGSTDRWHLFQQARSASHSAIPYVFMG